ncbi:enoyl-CoA hydratase/isomerase family protein [Sphingomonas sp. J315]|uniref:enoyl-CoA hydratase/isomerase family protein n=1 Tax=Sphingomonas sp. J315 TaxID=2898433 RepID=UPI0021AE202D|nr:enoyl-CoA hydratase/isomerase family protein [Sphingomonas sp. J315]UUX99614.1 enoyl-CoA hydratase/isomerase family protein [Sphingomonas sp. J315]UUX99644.1 enoyl-CoA hydratase/isomerase family protein [Sphingomonas sp. J315]
MIHLQFHEATALLTLDRGGARNALAIAAWDAIADATALVAASDARVLIIESAMPGMFSAGADLSEFSALVRDPAMRTRFRTAMARGIEAAAALPVPVIAAVDGGCFGAAVALTLACDIVVAGDAALFATTPARLGIGYPATDVARLRERVGAGQAARMLFTGDRIDADEAARIGLAHRRVADADGEARAMAEMIAANDPDAVRMLKAVLRDPGDPAHDRSFEDAFGSSGFAERLEAFLGGKR